MKRIVYAGGSVITDSRTADLVLEYAALLAQGDTAETVDLIAIGPDGEAGSMKLLLGPASQLLSEPTDCDAPEPDNSAAIAVILDRMRRFASARPVPEDPLTDAH